MYNCISDIIIHSLFLSPSFCLIPTQKRSKACHILDIVRHTFERTCSPEAPEFQDNTSSVKKGSEGATSQPCFSLLRLLVPILGTPPNLQIQVAN